MVLSLQTILCNKDTVNHNNNRNVMIKYPEELANDSNSRRASKTVREKIQDVDLNNISKNTGNENRADDLVGEVRTHQIGNTDKNDNVVQKKTKKRHPQEVALEKQRCQLNGYLLHLNFPNCYGTEVKLNTCIGACLSANGPFDAHNTAFSEIAKCCKVVEYKEVHVRLKCRYRYQFHTVRTATKCHCVKC